MTFETVIYETFDNHVAEITMNRPQARNTFNPAMADDLCRAFVAADKDPAVRVVLLKGAGKAFSAGIDVKDLGDKTAMEYREWIENMERPLVAISKMKKPVIAMLHGFAVANGMGLVAAADLAIAAQNARMGLTAINVGLNCVGPVIPVARCVGRKKALELLFYGEMITAPQALDMGLVNKVVPEDELEAEARNWAAELAQKSPIALQIAKTGFYATEDMAYEKQFSFMNEAFARLCTCSDAKEGVAAFLEKRAPVWKEK